MTIDEAISILNADIDWGNEFSWKDDALGVAIECMERCKRIDDANIRDGATICEDARFICNEYNRGWNDCLEWAKGEE